MSKLEIKQKRRIRQLEEALKPFAEVHIPEQFHNKEFLGSNPGGDVRLYVGTAQKGFPGELHTDHFFMAQCLLRTDR